MGDEGWAGKFFPDSLKFFILRRSVDFLDRQAFQACTQCGHTWARLDAGGLRDLLESSGTSELKARLRKAGPA